MDKLSQLKSAEVAGVISGLIDTGYLKLASDKEFEALTDVVAGSISDNWDINEVLNKTAEVVDYVNNCQDPATEKTAELDKLANFKVAEVAGVLSGLVDTGYLKLASDEEFDKLAYTIAGSISDDWDLKEVLSKTAEALDGQKATAQDILADYGLLCLAKEAEEISEEDFQKEAAVTMEELDKVAGKYSDMYGKAKDVVSAKDFRSMLAWNMNNSNAHHTKVDMAKSLLAPAAAVGAPVVVGGAAYGANKYRKSDRFKSDKETVKGQTLKAREYAKALLDRMRG